MVVVADTSPLAVISRSISAWLLSKATVIPAEIPTAARAESPPAVAAPLPTDVVNTVCVDDRLMLSLVVSATLPD